MVLSFPDDVVAALRDHQSGRLVGLAVYQDRTAELDVESSGSVSFTASGEIQSDASITVKGFGDSLVPKSKDALLAPYGQEVSLFRELILRDSVWRIPLGVFRITGNSGAFEDVRLVVPPSVSNAADALAEAGNGLWAVPVPWVENPSGSGLYDVPGSYVEDPPGSGLYTFSSARESYSAVRSVVLGWSVDVELKDRFRALQRANFVDQKSPVPGNSMYAEIRRLALMPVQENPAIPDVDVPTDLVYESGRLGAVQALAALAGAVPSLTRQGVLTVRPLDAWAEPELDPVFDIEGTISWSDGMSDEFVNYVRAASTDDEFVGFAFIDDDADPFSVNRAGPSTFEHKSPLYTSTAEAESGAQTTLRRLRGRRSREVEVECTPEALLLELGDVGWVRDPVQGRAVLGEVSALDFPNDVTQPPRLTLIVAEES
jgi:hypothetical protein